MNKASNPCIIESEEKEMLVFINKVFMCIGACSSKPKRIAVESAKIFVELMERE